MTAVDGAVTPTQQGGFRQLIRQGEATRVLLPLIVAIVALSIYTGTQNDAFLTWRNAENILLQTSVLGIVALGQTYLIAAGQLDLSVGSLASFIGVLGATMLRDGSSEAWMFIACLIVGALVGLAWGLIVTKLKVPPFILTLGGLSVFQSLALVRAGDVPVPARGQLGWLKTEELLGLRTPILLFILVALASALVMRFTRFGRQLLALGSSEEASYLAGLPTDRTKIMAFVINSTLVALAGLILMARIGAGDPRSGGGLELKAIAAVVLGGATLAGGRGSALGTFLGVILLGVVGASLTFLDVDSSYEDLVFGGVLIFAVVTTAIGDHRDRPIARLIEKIRQPFSPEKENES